MQGIRVVIGVPAEWGACSRTVYVGHDVWALECWQDIVAAASDSSDIVILDRITGSQTAVLSGHTNPVRSLAFSPSGTLLVSGSSDYTLKLWDVQTGGVIKTLCGHTSIVNSVSISSDCTMIASGSMDGTMRLWDVLTGECRRITNQQGCVDCVCFSPTDPRHLISVSANIIQQWNISDHQTGRAYDGSHVAFSLDGTRLVSCNGTAITVRATDSGAIMAEFHAAGDNFNGCCLSPDNRFVAVSAGKKIYIWDITSPDPHPVETLINHDDLTTPVFSSSSSLISASFDESLKFWQIGASLEDQAATNPEPISLVSTPIVSISLQARDGIVVSVDSAGVVRTWDVLTGLPKASFQTPAEVVCWGNARLIGDRLIIVWSDTDARYSSQGNSRINFWDAEKGGRPWTVDVSNNHPRDLTVSGDGSRIFLVDLESIQAWSVQTGETAGEVRLPQSTACLDPLRMDGSKVSVRFLDLSNQGWDFGAPGSPPIPLPSTSLDRPRLDFIDGNKTEDGGLARIEDTVTGEEVFRLSGRYVQPFDVQWDGRYLAVCYGTAEILILDFDRVLPHLK